MNAGETQTHMKVCCWCVCVCESEVNQKEIHATGGASDGASAQSRILYSRFKGRLKAGEATNRILEYIVMHNKENITHTCKPTKKTKDRRAASSS